MRIATCARCHKERQTVKCYTCDIDLCVSVETRSTHDPDQCINWHRCGRSEVCPACQGAGVICKLRTGVLVFSLDQLFGPPEPCPYCNTAAEDTHA